MLLIEPSSKKVLLLKRAQDDFMVGFVVLPSETVDLNEFLIEALSRKVTEETSLKITNIVSYLGFFDYIFRSGKKNKAIFV